MTQISISDNLLKPSSKVRITRSMCPGMYSAILAWMYFRYYFSRQNRVNALQELFSWQNSMNTLQELFPWQTVWNHFKNYFSQQNTSNKWGRDRPRERYQLFTRRGRETHICVGNLTIIGSDNGLSPGRRQAITWTNAGILLMGPL